MEDGGDGGTSPAAESAADAELALRRLDELVNELSDAAPARAALSAIRRALYVAHFHAHTDALTGLMNRACFTQALSSALARAERAHEVGALLFIDLDDFKQINDELGHAVGDEVLAVSAHRIREAVREGDLTARFGGDEFVAFLVNVAPESALAVAERLIGSIETPCATSSGARRVTPSVGVAYYPDHGRSVEELLRHADRAMYRAKGLGGAASAVFGEPDQAQNKNSASGAFPSPFNGHITLRQAGADKLRR